MENEKYFNRTIFSIVCGFILLVGITVVSTTHWGEKYNTPLVVLILIGMTFFSFVCAAIFAGKIK
jgi:hypothetical protein